MRYFFPFFKSFAAFGSPLRILSAPMLAPLLGQPFLFDRNRLQEVNRKLAARVNKNSFFMWMFYREQITDIPCLSVPVFKEDSTVRPITQPGSCISRINLM
jgi:hypothetical protein